MRSEVSFRAVWSENYNRGKSPDAVVGHKNENSITQKS